MTTLEIINPWMAGDSPQTLVDVLPGRWEGFHVVAKLPSALPGGAFGLGES